MEVDESWCELGSEIANCQDFSWLVDKLFLVSPIWKTSYWVKVRIYMVAGGVSSMWMEVGVGRLRTCCWGVWGIFCSRVSGRGRNQGYVEGMEDLD